MSVYRLLRRLGRRPGRPVEPLPADERVPAVAVVDDLSDEEPVTGPGPEALDGLASAGRLDPAKPHPADATSAGVPVPAVVVDGRLPGALDTPTPPGGVLRVIVPARPKCSCCGAQRTLPLVESKDTRCVVCRAIAGPLGAAL